MEHGLWIKIGARILKSFSGGCETKTIDLGVCRIVSYSSLEEINNNESIPDCSFDRKMFLRKSAEFR